MILHNQIPDKTALTIEKVDEGEVYVECTIKAIIKASEIQELYDTLDACRIQIFDYDHNDGDDEEEGEE